MSHSRSVSVSSIEFLLRKATAVIYLAVALNPIHGPTTTTITAQIPPSHTHFSLLFLSLDSRVLLFKMASKNQNKPPTPNFTNASTTLSNVRFDFFFRFFNSLLGHNPFWVSFLLSFFLCFFFLKFFWLPFFRESCCFGFASMVSFTLFGFWKKFLRFDLFSHFYFARFLCFLLNLLI